MQADAFRFVHAADLHLEQPLYGLDEIPDAWRDRLIDAPTASARRVFDTAIEQSADFIVLAGDVIDAQSAGPRAIGFLIEQFERLAEQNIAVYWAGGQVDEPDNWPAAIGLPANVHVFGKGKKAESVTHERHGHAVATIVGLSAGRQNRVPTAAFRASPDDTFTVAVAHGETTADALAKQDVHYWALGGRHKPKALVKSPYIARYAGTPQGRCPQESGPHGCVLVHVDAAGQARSQSVLTSVIQWRTERISLSASASRDDLEAALGDRMLNVVAEAGDCAVLVTWRIDGGHGLGTKLRRGLSDDLLRWLRREFGNGSPAAWSLSVEAESPASFASQWYDEDTILGDFLRAVQHQETEDKAIDVNRFLADPQIPKSVADAMRLDPKHYQHILRQAASLGVDLLSGQDAA